MPRIRIEQEDHIVQIVLTRAEKKNAMDDAMIDALIEAGEQVAASDARAVVLCGEGDSFCAGIDISGLTRMIGRDMEAQLLPRSHGQGTTNRWQEVAMMWHRMDIPVIAALHGAVYGAGLQLALGADIRFAGPDSRLAVMEMKWGIVPDMGGMVLLPRLVRDDVMRRLIYTAAPIDAEEAARCGLVTQVVENPLAAARTLAAEIAGKGPNAIQAAKALCAQAWTGTSEEVLLAESAAQARLLGQPEQMEVIAAQFAKRAPLFK